MSLAAAADGTSWAMHALSLGLAVLALIAIRMSMPSPLRARTSPSAYTCYCSGVAVRVAFRAEPEPAEYRRWQAWLEQPPRVPGVTAGEGRPVPEAD
ncbi:MULTISPECIES: hypothetical protein [unclassified Streptomyces]|uniref:hypothetical protein n=1 Tax=unclassified Streptomyces TaxID=2593676 RepID=UPI0029BF978B|nr:hypothetical protein [Streptomyces sp. DK15]MDX2392525.1 hypothetical protein [Streptomyces sp. DK15]